MLFTLLVVLALIVLLLFLSSLQPTECRYERRVLIAAPAATIYPQVNGLKNWPAWSPWEKADPAMKRTFAGPDSGEGANYAWEGNRQVGAGRMTVTESRPGERIVLRLDFLRPFACTNRVEFTFTPTTGGTIVTWTMSGKNLFIGRVMGVFINMDQMLGQQFEQGLANLKTISESGAR